MSCDSKQKADPEAEALVNAMHVAFDRGDLGRTLVLTDSAETIAPDLPEISYMRGRVLAAMRQYPAADSAFEATLALDEAFPGAAYQRGHSAFLQRKYREALKYYSNEQALLEAGRGAATEEALPTIIAQIGRTYAMLGVPDSARTAYEKALRADSSLAVAHGWLSEILETEGDDAGALNHALKALKANPMEIEYGYRVGALLFQMGRASEAIPYLSTVVQRWPGHEGAAFNLGRALQVEGQMEEGMAQLERVEQIRALQNQAMVAERGVETYPNDPQRWIELAGFMMQMGHFDRAETAFNAAKALKPADLTLQSDLANLAFARGDTATAVYRYQSMLRQDSTFTDGWLNLGVMYAMTGDRDAARMAWKTVLRHNPEDAQARQYLEQLNQ